MPLFGKKKKKQKEEKEDFAIELFHVAGLSKGMTESELYVLEGAVFDKTFKDLLEEGYTPSLAIKDDNGALWTALGKMS